MTKEQKALQFTQMILDYWDIPERAFRSKYPEELKKMKEYQLKYRYREGEYDDSFQDWIREQAKKVMED